MVDSSLTLDQIHSDWLVNDSFKPFYRNTSVDIVNMLRYFGYMYYNTKSVDQILRKYIPKKSERDVLLLSYYQNQTKYEAGIRTQIKSGKLLKKLFPLVTDEQAEAFTNWYKNKFVLCIDNLTYKVSKKAEDFKFAYTKYKSSKGIDNSFYDRGYKSISESCMKENFGYPCHPSEAYASGDFEIHNLVDENDYTVARCTVYVTSDSFAAAPIYASSISAGDYLKDKMKAYRVEHGLKERDDWIGAKLNKILYRDYDYQTDFVECIGPYLDYQGYLKSFSDDYFVIIEYSNNMNYSYRYNSRGKCELYKAYYNGKVE